MSNEKQSSKFTKCLNRSIGSKYELLISYGRVWVTFQAGPLNEINQTSAFTDVSSQPEKHVFALSHLPCSIVVDYLFFFTLWLFGSLALSLSLSQSLRVHFHIFDFDPRLSFDNRSEPPAPTSEAPPSGPVHWWPPQPPPNPNI